MKQLLVILSILITKLAMGQNLVPNPSFEIMAFVPSRDHFGVSCASGWICPMGTIGDYFNRASKDKQSGVPENRFGYQEPHSGDGYAGICIESGMIEYLEIGLTNSLIEGKSYLIEFYISKADKKSRSVNEFGIMFSDKLEYVSEMTGISEKPQVDFVNDKGYEDKIGWTKLSTEYIAKGYESVILLGHFNYDNPKFKGKTHYYIDDVSITPIGQKESTR